MLLKRSKKALSHVDWAMSLAIFLLYLSWFFIFVKPVLAPAQNMDVLLDILDTGVKDSMFQDISRVKVYVPGNMDSDYEPIIIPYAENWVESNIAHSADYFMIDGDKMFFMANLSNTSMYNMYYPHKAVRKSAPLLVVADENVARFESFSAFFNSFMLDRIFFMDANRLFDFKITVDDTESSGDDGAFYNMTFMAKYVKQSDYVNMTSYVFADNPRIYTYIESSDHRNHSVAIDYASYNYTSYYFDTLRKGDLKYSIAPQCRFYEGNFLDLYSTDSGLLVTFGKNITFRLCTNETAVLVTMIFDVGSEDNFNIYLHSGDYRSVTKYPLKPIVGVTEDLSTVSKDKVLLLKNREYGYLKQKFGYPQARDFNITVSSDDVSASYGILPPAIADVYARKIEGVMLGPDYSQKRVLLTLNVW